MQVLKDNYGLGVFIRFFEFGGQLWTIMQYCEFSLKDVIELKGIFSKSQKNSKQLLAYNAYISVEIILQICSTTIDTIEAVSKYSKDVPTFAHGDIKPENLLFKIDGQKKTVMCHLIDFRTGIRGDRTAPNLIFSSNFSKFEENIKLSLG